MPERKRTQNPPKNQKRNSNNSKEKNQKICKEKWCQLEKKRKLMAFDTLLFLQKDISNKPNPVRTVRDFRKHSHSEDNLFSFKTVLHPPSAQEILLSEVFLSHPLYYRNVRREEKERRETKATQKNPPQTCCCGYCIPPMAAGARPCIPTG